MHTPQEWLRDRTLIVLILVVGVALQVPGGSYAIYPIHVFSSWMHELFHGLAALAVDGRFYSLKIYPDGSGMSLLQYPPTRFTHVFVASAGYACTVVTGVCLLLYQWPSRTTKAVNLILVGGLLSLAALSVSSWKGKVYYGVVSLFLLTMTFLPNSHRSQSCRVGLSGIAVMLLSSLLFVRELFAVIAILAMAGICLVISFRTKDRVVWLCYNVLAIVCAFQTLFYVRALFSPKHLTQGIPSRLSDAMLFEKVFFLAAAPFWSFLGLLLSMAFVILGLVHVFLIHSTKPKKQRLHPWL